MLLAGCKPKEAVVFSAAPLVATLPEKLLFIKVREALFWKMAPPLPPPLFPLKMQFVKLRVAKLLYKPPPEMEAELPENRELLMTGLEDE